MRILFASRVLKSGAIQKRPFSRINYGFSTLNGNLNSNNNNNHEAPQEDQPSKLLMYSQIFGFLRKYFIPFGNPDETLRSSILKTYSLLCLSKLCFFAVPFSLKFGINYLQHPTTAYLSPLCFIAYGISTVLLTIFEGRKAQYSAQISLTAWKDISLETYRHLLDLDANFHYNSSQKSRLFSLYKAHQYIEKNIRQVLNYFLPLSIDFLAAGVYLWLCFGSEFFMTFSATIILYAAFTLKTSSGRKPVIFKQKENDKLADFIISESLANFYTVKHFNAEELQLKKYAKVLQKYINFNLTNTGSLWQLNLGQKVIFASGLTVNLVMAVWKVQSGTLTPGDVVFLQALMMQIMAPLNFLGNFYREYSESLYEMKELFSLLARKPRVQEKPNAKGYEFKGGAIEFQGVDFAFNEHQKVLKGLTLTVDPGMFVSIVGESGVGKSTILSLIYRFYDPDQGKVLLDGQDIRDLKLESFRKRIGVASQQATMFNDSILFNLQYANPSKTREEIIEVCKDVRLHEFIMALPEGYDTIVGEQGNKLSGGEKQRLSFARCILKDADILLLDEITSSLDASNENNLMRVLQNLRRKNPKLVIVMVTHRLHLNDFADRTYMIAKDGSIETGVHRELILQKDSKYFRLWRKFCEKVSISLN